MQASPELLIQPYLAQGERLLWSGRPRKGITLQRWDFFGFGMGLVGIAVLGGSIVAAVADGDYGELVPLVPFSILWIGLAVGQPFWRARRQRNAVYALTDRRALILQGNSTEVQSVSLVSEPIVTLQTHRDGRGTILFGNHNAYERQQGTGPAFRNIDDANAVYQLIQGVQSRPLSGNW